MYFTPSKYSNLSITEYYEGHYVQSLGIKIIIIIINGTVYVKYIWINQF